MPDVKKLRHKKQISLLHPSECIILGADSDNNFYIEEYYDYTYIAHHQLTLDGDILETRDEASGKNTIDIFSVDDLRLKPERPRQHFLNYTALRLRGMRQSDKVSEWVRPLPIQDKMPLLQTLNLQISPMMLMGIAESRVLAQTKLSDDVDLVCRKIRLLIALPEPKLDSTGLPYDYDTLVIHVLHPYHHYTDHYPPLHQALKLFPQLDKPSDCLLVNETLIIANSSDGASVSEIHLFQFDDDDLQSMLD